MTWKWTLNEALMNVRSEIESRVNNRYILTLHTYKDTEFVDCKFVDDEVDVGFKYRMEVIFNQLSFEDQIHITTIHPGFFYKMLDSDQQIAFKLVV